MNKPKIVKLHPKHIATRNEWWCVTKHGCHIGGLGSPGSMRDQAFEMRDKHRARGEDATVYAVTVRYQALRVVEKRK
jgi:hypothetical protein